MMSASSQRTTVGDFKSDHKQPILQVEPKRAAILALLAVVSGWLLLNGWAMTMALM